MFDKYKTVAHTGKTAVEATQNVLDALPKSVEYDIKVKEQDDGTYLATCKYQVEKQEKVVSRGGGSAPSPLEQKLRF